jgi:hypothetical protein
MKVIAYTVHALNLMFIDLWMEETDTDTDTDTIQSLYAWFLRVYFYQSAQKRAKKLIFI